MLQGWPKLKRSRGNLDGYPVRQNSNGNLSGWPDISRRLELTHPINLGLRGWWPLGETQGLVTRDLSTFGTRATLSGFIPNPWVAGPRIGGALEFDGVDDTVTPASSYSFNLGASDFAMSVWYRTTGGGTYILMANYSAGANWWFGIQSGLITFSNNGPQIQVATTSNDGKWHHAVASRTSGIVSIYVDGVLGVSGSLAGTTNPSGTLYLGAFVIPGSYPWPGGMNQVRFRASALAAYEVKQIYSDPWIGSVGGIQ